MNVGYMSRRNEMRKKYNIMKIICSLLLSIALIFHSISMISPFPVEAATSEISDQDSIKMSEALNMSTDSEVYDIGANPYRIFDTNKDGFNKLFVNSEITDIKNISFSGNSRAEINSEYGKERATGLGVGAKAPIGGVSANISANFQTNISSSLKSINEEFYEYYETYKQTRVITTDWLARDLSEYFTESFKSDLNTINSVESAVKFLEKYGTHVFNKYYMGGSLIITNYIVSEASIKEEYESENKTIGLDLQVASAIQANGEDRNYSIEGNNVSNEQTKSKMNMRARGGVDFNALNVNDLFTFKTEIGGENKKSGYIYSEWLKSLDAGEREVVIKVSDPVPVWELIKKSRYSNPTILLNLQKAFDVMCYRNYAKLCNENGMNSDIIGSVKYNANGANVEFNITNNTIKLPSNITAKFELGDVIRNEKETDVKIVLDENYDFASINNNNEIQIGSAAIGKTLVLKVTLYNEEVYSLNIEIEDNGSSSYANGYGTKDQPYIISTPDQWNMFINSRDSYNKKTYYKLANDIDLKGKIDCEIAGASAREPFKGVLDGGNHCISNFSIIAKSEWENIGIFGVNMGTIQNLKVDNVKVLNNGIISSINAEINAGVLVGDNKGIIENVRISNSSIRITTQLENAQMNEGILCGCSTGEILYCGISDCNIYGQSWKEEGTINVGGMVGQVKISKVSNCYTRNLKVNAYNQESKKSSYTIGGLVGLVYSEEEIKPEISYCISYDNKYNTTDGAFGYIAGSVTENNFFENSYFESDSDKAVNGSSMNGCKMLKKLNLSDIGDAEFNKNWTTDSYGKVILKIHS